MISPSVIHVDDLAYDYTQITDPNLRTLAQRAAEEIKPRLRRATEDILTIGNRLATVRQYLPHGQWMDWLDTEFEMGDETARHFINVATRFSDKYQKFGNLKPSALYALAAPSTPDDAIAEVETHLANGYIPTVAETKTIIAQAKAPSYSAAAESSLAHLVGRTTEPQASASVPTQPTDNIELSPDLPSPSLGEGPSVRVSPAVAPTDDGPQWLRLQAIHIALSDIINLLHQEHAQTAEDYGFGIEFQRLIIEAKTLRSEIKNLTPAHRINS